MLDTPLDDLFAPFQNEYENLSLEELFNVLRVPPPEELEADFNTNSVQMYVHITAAILNYGAAGRKALWDEVDRAHPAALRAILALHMGEHREATRVRRTLFKLLEGDDPARTVVALEGIEFSEDRKARSRVLAVADHPHPRVRARVLKYMISLFPSEAFPMLIEALDDDDPEVRMTVLGDLMLVSVIDAQSRIREAIGPLRKDRDPDVHHIANQALDHGDVPYDYGSDLLSDGLAELEYRKGRTRRIWKDVARAEKHDDIETLSLLLAALIIADPQDERVRSKVRSLIIDPKGGMFTNADDPYQAVDAIYLLGVMGDWEVQDMILDLRSSDDPLTAEAAYTYARYLDPVAAIETNLDLLSSLDPYLRSCAIARLGQIQQIEVDPDLRARVAALKDDPEEGIQKLAEIMLLPGWERRLRANTILATLQQIS